MMEDLFFTGTTALAFARPACRYGMETYRRRGGVGVRCRRGWLQRIINFF